MVTLQGCWTIALYFGLLGIVWLPRYYVIPPRLRLWPSYLFYNSLTQPFSLSTYSIPTLEDNRVYSTKNYTIDVEYKDECFSCQLQIRPKYCSTLLYSDIIFDSEHTADNYEVYTYETYPCYQTLAGTGRCVVDDRSAAFSGTGCTLCSLCHKNTIFNTSRISKYRKFSHTPRYSLRLHTAVPDAKIILHCLNKLVLVKFFSRDQFCGNIRDHIAVYKHDKTTLFTGCNSFCTDAVNIVLKELYATEVAVYLMILAVIVILVLLVIYCIRYTFLLYTELGILNIPWSCNATCPICMDRLHRFIRISTLHCGHKFCKTCLYQWLRVFSHVTCPLCRQHVDPNSPPTDLTVATEALQPILMLSEHSDQTDQEDSDRGSDTSPHFSLIQSIYNLGLDVVSSWTHSAPDIRTEAESTAVPADPMVVLEPSTNHSTESDHVTGPSAIPMPYYPIYNLDSTSSSSVYNSVIVPYRGGMLPSQDYSSVLYPPLLHSPPHSPPHLLHTPTDYITSWSDTEVAASSLQNRIARKINRSREKRQRARSRRTHSTSDITSVTSESERDVL